MANFLEQWRASEQSVHWKFVSVLAATNLNLFADLEVDFRVLPGEEAEGLRFAHCIREFCRQDMIFNNGRINYVWQGRSVLQQSKTMISCFLCCDITNVLIDEHIFALVEVI